MEGEPERPSPQNSNLTWRWEAQKGGCRSRCGGYAGLPSSQQRFSHSCGYTNSLLPCCQALQASFLRLFRCLNFWHMPFPTAAFPRLWFFFQELLAKSASKTQVGFCISWVSGVFQNVCFVKWRLCSTSCGLPRPSIIFFPEKAVMGGMWLGPTQRWLSPWTSKRHRGICHGNMLL